MPLRKVRVVVETRRLPIEPVKKGPFRGCPQTRWTEFVRRQEVDMSKYNFDTPFEIYGVRYSIISLGGWRGNRRFYEVCVRIEDDQVEAFLANAKAAGDRWKKRTAEQVDARSLFMQIPL